MFKLFKALFDGEYYAARVAGIPAVRAIPATATFAIKLMVKDAVCSNPNCPEFAEVKFGGFCSYCHTN